MPDFNAYGRGGGATKRRTKVVKIGRWDVDGLAERGGISDGFLLIFVENRLSNTPPIHNARNFIFQLPNDEPRVMSKAFLFGRTRLIHIKPNRNQIYSTHFKRLHRYIKNDLKLNTLSRLIIISRENSFFFFPNMLSKLQRKSKDDLSNAPRCGASLENRNRIFGRIIVHRNKKKTNS